LEEKRILLDIILLLVLLFFTSFLSAAESALSSLKQIHLKSDSKEKEKTKESELLKLWLENPNELLTTLLFVKTISYSSMVFTGVYLIKRIYAENLFVGISFFVLIVLILIFSEMVPRLIARNNIYGVSKTLIIPLNTIRIVLKPLIRLFIHISRFIVGIFKIKVKDQMFEITEDEILTINEDANFIIAYDPLDGSSLVDVNLSVGSIFGIYDGKIEPNALKCAIYAVYGPRLELVICIDTPKLYRLNRAGEFEFIRELKLNEKGKLNATGATQQNWSTTHKKLVQSLFDEGYRLRYSGAMVADLHQILLKGGGLFSYPATSDHTQGKLRVTFEVLPFAFIYERANGATSDGKNSTLFEIKITKIHQTTPCFFGSKYEIAKLHEIYG